jgi:hypothetical protein
MISIKLPAKRPFSWKVFALIAVVLLPISYVTLPYFLTTVGAELAPGELTRILVSTLINGLIYVAAAGLGLFLATRIGTGLPFLEGWVKKEPIWDRFGGVVKQSVVIGVLTALVIMVLVMVVFSPLMQAELSEAGIVIPEERLPPPWQGFLASFYGGITEEVQMRLFVMTLVAAIGGLLFKDEDGRPKKGVFWFGIVTAAVIFGLGHLPSTAAMGIPITPLVVTRAVLLNGIGGVMFGWLYFKSGLESAMIAHFSADIVVHVIWPMVTNLFV